MRLPTTGHCSRWMGPRVGGGAAPYSTASTGSSPSTPPTPSTQSPGLRGPEFDAKRRLFYPHDLYNPADLSQVAPPTSSPLRQGQRLISLKPLSLLGVRDPRKHYKDSELLSLYINEMGMIRGRKDTGLTSKMQARMAKAIRRARCLGFLPFTYNPYSQQ